MVSPSNCGPLLKCYLQRILDPSVFSLYCKRTYSEMISVSPCIECTCYHSEFSQKKTNSYRTLKSFSFRGHTVKVYGQTSDSVKRIILTKVVILSLLTTEPPCQDIIDFCSSSSINHLSSTRFKRLFFVTFLGKRLPVFINGNYIFTFSVSYNHTLQTPMIIR